MKITKGKQQRPQRVVLYGVESVGKSTFAAQFPKPLFLDVEGGTSHLDTDRASIESGVELESAIADCKTLEYQTIIVDSIDWVERLITEQLLTETKKKSIEDFGYGKGWVQVAERMSRLLRSLDELIERGKHVVLIAHSKVQRVEPPDLLAAFDRYELKMSKQSSPLVKEWADELWFFRFKTKTVESGSGKMKGVGGKERVILTTHSAAYDAKTRSGLAEELPMEWGSVAHLFSGSQPVPKQAAKDTLASIIGDRAEQVELFLIAKNMISEGETFHNLSDKWRERIEADPAKFLAAVETFMENGQR